MRDIGQPQLPILQAATRSNRRHGRPVRTVQAVLAREHGEVGQGDLVALLDGRGRDAEEGGVERGVADRQLVVAAVIQILPLQLAVGARQPRRRAVGAGQADVLPVRARRRHGRPRELDAHGPGPRARVVRVLVQPDQVRDPGRVRVAGQEHRVADVVLVQRRKGPVPVRLVPVPRVAVEGVLVAQRQALVHAAEDDLVADDAPRRPARRAVLELAVEPRLLPGAHQAAAGVVGDLVYVVRVPVQVGDGAVVLTRVEHDQVKEIAKAEISPDAQIVVHFHLADRH